MTQDDDQATSFPTATMGSKTPQRLQLCTCQVVGCGMGQFWCPLHLEYIPGKWIPKAMYSRHQIIDKLAGYLESWGGAENIPAETDPTFEDDTMQESDNLDVEESSERPSFVSLNEPVTHCDPTELMRLKEGATAVEDTLHDLMHLCSAITQKIMSFSCDFNLVFESHNETTDGSAGGYEPFTSVPAGPNMGHRQLCTMAPENAPLLAYESELYDVLVSLHNLRKHPSLESSRLKFLALVEDELYRIDYTWQAVWNRRLDGKPSLDHQRNWARSPIIVNTGM